MSNARSYHVHEKSEIAPLEEIMKLLAFDLETTGLIPHLDQILQIGAVVFDHEDVMTPVEKLPHFVTDVRHDRYHGSAFALQMNHEILMRTATNRNTPTKSGALTMLSRFIANHFPRDEYKRGPHPVGFNVAAFDVAFVKAAGYDLFSHRPVELGSLLSKDGLPVTSKDAVKKYFNKAVAHDALEDARDAVRLYRVWKECLV